MGLPKEAEKIDNVSGKLQVKAYPASPLKVTDALVGSP